MKTKKEELIEWNYRDAVFCYALSKRYSQKVSIADILVLTEEIDKIAMPYYYLNKAIRKLVTAGVMRKVDDYFIIDEYLDMKIKAEEVPIEITFGWHEKLENYFKPYPIKRSIFSEVPQSIYSPQEYHCDYEYLEFVHNDFNQHKQLPKMLDYEIIALDGVSDDPTYGYSEDNPINVGGFKTVGKEMVECYFKSLLGYDGYEILYKRIASVKEIPTRAAKNGHGFIDKYEVEYQSSHEPIHLYINMYDYEPPVKAPIGFIPKPPYFLD